MSSPAVAPPNVQYLTNSQLAVEFAALLRSRSARETTGSAQASPVAVAVTALSKNETFPSTIRPVSAIGATYDSVATAVA